MSFTVTAPPIMAPRKPTEDVVAARDGVELVVERWVAAKATVAALSATTAAATPIQSILRLIILLCRCLAGCRLASVDAQPDLLKVYAHTMKKLCDAALLLSLIH